MKKIGSIYILFVLSIIIFSCKKEDETTPTSTPPNSVGTFQEINNIAFANATNELQSVYTSGNGQFKSYTYGSFKADGTADSVREMIITKLAGDTSILFSFDNQMRVQSAFMIINGIKQNSILTFDYETSGKVILNSSYFDFNTDSTKLLKQVILNDLGGGNYSFADSTSFRSAYYSSSPIKTFNNKNYFGGDFAFALGGVAVCNTIIMVATTGIGCLVGGFPGCIVGGIVADYMITGPGSANASTISSASGAPPSPSNQTQSTTLSNSFSGTRLNVTSDVNSVGSTFLIRTVTLKIALNSTRTAIMSASLNQRELYTEDFVLTSSSIVGSSINLNFSTGPSWDATSMDNYTANFVGNLSGNNIYGSYTFSYTSPATSLVHNYSPIVMNLKSAL